MTCWFFEACADLRHLPRAVFLTKANRRKLVGEKGIMRLVIKYPLSIIFHHRLIFVQAPAKRVIW